MELSLNQVQEQRQHISPSLIALTEILVMSSQQLQQEISKELADNPALELVERRTCMVCGTAYNGRACPRCSSEGSGAPSNDDKTTNDDFYRSHSSEDYYRPEEGQPNQESELEFDPITLVAAEMPLSERLLLESGMVFNASQMAIVEFLVGSLDERGYLSVSVEMVAQTFNVGEEQVEQLLKELQRIAPPGVGARNLKECLLLQFNFVQENGSNAPFVQEIIEHYLKELGGHKYGYIGQQLHISTDEVKQARDFIKSYLNPYPAEGHTAEPNGINWRSGRVKTGYVVPDVIISEREGHYEVEVVESKRFVLKLNSMYVQLNKEMGNGADYTSGDREHIHQYVSRAKFFMSNINQRRETMLKITRCLVETQEEFLREGVRGLRAMTRSEVASYIGMHESTVSRATAGKYVMLPNRKVIPYSAFFLASSSIMDVLREIIETEEETNNKPRTDEQLVTLLEEQGIRVARRTVAKYRSKLKILPSTLR